jgi:hypothetical protein
MPTRRDTGRPSELTVERGETRPCGFVGGGVSETLKALDEALYNISGGLIQRGGALTASPSEEVRRRIREFKRIDAVCGPGLERKEMEEWRRAEMRADEAGREATLAELFAASRKNGNDGAKRPKGYAPWRPQGKTVVIIAQVQDILTEYRAELPLTARQIFYRLVGAYGYSKDERAYERLTNILVRARRARMIAFESIRDDGASVMASRHYDGEEAFYSHVLELGKGYERDKLATQKIDVRIYCEAAGMMPQISRVSSRYSVPVYSCSGFDSLTAKYDLFQDIASAFTYRGRRTVVLHLGDYDPSGENIFDVIEEDVHAFLLSAIPHKDPGLVALFKRVALTPEMIDEYDLPTAPAKRSDSRSKRWGGRETCQLEALPPDVLSGVLAATIESYLDAEILKADREAEAEERRRIARALPTGRAS